MIRCDARWPLEGRDEACGVRWMEISRLWIGIILAAIVIVAVFRLWFVGQFDEVPHMTNDVKRSSELEQFLLIMKEEDEVLAAVKGK